MDDVPISLRPAFDSPFPSDLEVLTKLRKKVNELSKKANRPYATKKYI
jgi:formylmethanofuran dehydrogenase subunit B